METKTNKPHNTQANGILEFTSTFLQGVKLQLCYRRLIVRVGVSLKIYKNL